jgi:choline dehydrogenase
MTAYQTYSRGRLRITSPNPETDPDVRFRMLSDERDLIRMRDGIRRLREFARHPVIRETADAVGFGNPMLMVQGRLEEPPDGNNESNNDTLDDWMRANCFDSQHAAGTCRMGLASDPRTVVGTDCRVMGIEGLRVIDCSVMPEIVRANTHLSTVMIAELMADKLRNSKN